MIVAVCAGLAGFCRKIKSWMIVALAHAVVNYTQLTLKTWTEE
jgi:hypothetical protein